MAWKQRAQAQVKRPPRKTKERKLKEEKLKRLIAEALTTCEKDIFYFIKWYVHIEDKTSPTGMTPFNLWPKQEEVLRKYLKGKFLVVLKARQLGLTWLSLTYILWCMLFRPGFMAIAISKRDDPDAIELGNRMQVMLKHLPFYIIKHKKDVLPNEQCVYWNSDAHEIIIYRPEGEPSRFLTLPASPDTAHSFTANLVMLDEWALHEYAYEIWTGAFPTMNRPDFSGQVLGISTGRAGTLFEEIFNNAMTNEGIFTPIFLDVWSDPRRTKEWYEATKKLLPNTWRSQYPEKWQDAFTVGEGAFFPEWDEEVHVIADPAWYPPSRCQIHGAYDAGYSSNACFKWYAVFPEGYIVAYREYYPRAVPDNLQAKEIMQMSVDTRGNPEYIVSVVADPSCWNKQSGSGESTAEVFARYGIYMTRADNDLSNGWRRLHQWLSPFKTEQGETIAGLRFTWNCPNTIRVYPGLRQKKTNPEDIANNESHSADTDRYFCMSRPNIFEGETFLVGANAKTRPGKQNFDTYYPDDDDDDNDRDTTFYGYC